MTADEQKLYQESSTEIKLCRFRSCENFVCEKKKLVLYAFVGFKASLET